MVEGMKYAIQTRNEVGHLSPTTILLERNFPVLPKPVIALDYVTTRFPFVVFGPCLWPQCPNSILLSAFGSTIDVMGSTCYRGIKPHYQRWVVY